jgi:hypothetical protein
MIHPDPSMSRHGEPRPRPEPRPTAAQTLARRNELFRLLRDGGNALFRTPLSAREIAALFGVSPRLVDLGIAEARATRRAVAELTADDPA